MDINIILTLLLAALTVGIVSYKFGNMQERIRHLEANYGHTKNGRAEHELYEEALFPVSKIYHAWDDVQRDIDNLEIKSKLVFDELEHYRNLMIQRTKGKSK